jgi:hypothetical protein
VRGASLISDGGIAREVASEWLGDGATLSPLVAMNSSAWTVSSGVDRYVLKIAGADEEAGLRAAAWLEERGLRTGAPVRMSVRRNRLVALLGFVDGRGLGTTAADVDLVGETLGMAHLLLVGAPRVGTHLDM